MEVDAAADAAPAPPPPQVGHGHEEEDAEALHHKRVATAWREGLHNLAQNLKCPICLGLMHSAAVAPCYHFACKSCWDQLLAAASGGGVHSACPMCKGPVTRRTVLESEAYNAMSRALERAVPAFGFAIDDSCNVTDPLEPPKPPPKPFVPLVPRPQSAATAASSSSSRQYSARGGTAPVTSESSAGGAAAAAADEDDEAAQSPRQAKRPRTSEEGERTSSRGSSALLREAEEAFHASFAPAGGNDDVEEEESDGEGEEDKMEVPAPPQQQERQEGGQDEEEDEEESSGSSWDESDDGRNGWGCEPPVPFAPGDCVEVAARTWPGINKEGGVARVSAYHEAAREYDVKYILTGKLEAGIPARFVRDALSAMGLATAAAATSGPRPGRATRHSMGSPLGSARSGDKSKGGDESGGITAPGGRRRGSAPARTAGGGGGGKGRGAARGLAPAPTSKAAAAAPAAKSRKRPAPSSASTAAAGAKENRPPPPSNIAAAAGGGHEAASSGKGKKKGPGAAPPPPEQQQEEQEPQQEYGPEGDTYLHRPQAMVILPTSLPHGMMAKLDEFVGRFGGRLARQPGPDVTHVVGKADGKQRRAEARTMKYLHGLLYRRWLVASSWVTASLAAGKLEPEHKHELTGDVKASEPNAPTKARLSRYKRTPGLFARHLFAFYGDFPPPRPARRDLESLITAGEGRVVPVQELAALLEEEQQPPVKYVVLCNSLPAPGSGAAPPPAAVVGAQGHGGHGRVQVVNSDWLLDSTSNYRVMPGGRYRMAL